MRSLLLTICLLCSVVLNAQTCMQGGITITTQAEIDLIPVVYPNCNTVAWNINIIGPNITNLNGLAGITTINGQLKIEDTSIQDFTGLHNLVEVKRGIIIERNPNLQSFNGLNSLTTVGIDENSSSDYWFAIWSQGGVTDFTGLGNLQNIYAKFRIVNCHDLVNFNGLGNLEYVWWLSTDSCSSLTSFTGLSSLTRVTEFSSENNFGLTSFAGLGSLNTIDGSFVLRYNGILTSLQGLNISTVGSVNIVNNDDLIDLNGLESIVSVSNSFVISHNNELLDISAVANIGFGGTVNIVGHPLLNVCDYFSTCDRLVNGGTINFSNNGAGCAGNIVVTAACILAADCLGVPYGPDAIGSACDDTNGYTINDMYDSNCVCNGTFIDCLGVVNGTTIAGSPCNDGDPSTGNDIFDSNCNCSGLPLDCLGVPGGSAIVGSSCNDGNPNTGNDAYDADCNCVGLPLDCLGVPGGTDVVGSFCDDLNPTTGNDTYDVNCNCVGLPLDCLGVPGGTVITDSPCNDNDPHTVLDTYDSNCNCVGQIVDCTIIDLVTNGAIHSFKAINSISSNSALNNITVTYKAGQSVEITTGFEYNVNGNSTDYFLATLEQCP